LQYSRVRAESGKVLAFSAKRCRAASAAAPGRSAASTAAA
jgi:hypothetical protein